MLGSRIGAQVVSLSWRLRVGLTVVPPVAWVITATAPIAPNPDPTGIIKAAIKVGAVTVGNANFRCLVFRYCRLPERK